MFQCVAVPDGVWVTAQEMTLDFTLFCSQKGCGPSETSCPLDEIKTQREAIRTTEPTVSKRYRLGPSSVAEYQRWQDPASTDRWECLSSAAGCRGQMWGPLPEVYITLQTQLARGAVLWVNQVLTITPAIGHTVGVKISSFEAHRLD